MSLRHRLLLHGVPAMTIFGKQSLGVAHGGELVMDLGLEVATRPL